MSSVALLFASAWIVEEGAGGNVVVCSEVTEVEELRAVLLLASMISSCSPSIPVFDFSDGGASGKELLSVVLFVGVSVEGSDDNNIDVVSVLNCNVDCSPVVEGGNDGSCSLVSGGAVLLLVSMISSCFSSIPVFDFSNGDVELLSVLLFVGVCSEGSDGKVDMLADNGAAVTGFSPVLTVAFPGDCISSFSSFSSFGFPNGDLSGKELLPVLLFVGIVAVAAEEVGDGAVGSASSSVFSSLNSDFVIGSVVLLVDETVEAAIDVLFTEVLDAGSDSGSAETAVFVLSVTVSDTVGAAEEVGASGNPNDGIFSSVVLLFVGIVGVVVEEGTGGNDGVVGEVVSSLMSSSLV